MDKKSKYGIHASEVDLSKVPDIKLPEPAPDGRIRVRQRLCNNKHYGYIKRICRIFINM